MNAALAEAIIEQWTWKTPAMKAMTLAVCRLALRGGEFSANDLPEFAHGGSGICGAIFNRLAKDQVITPVGAFVAGEFQQKTVRNAGGNRIGVWRLHNAARAAQVLTVHDAAPKHYQQVELLAS